MPSFNSINFYQNRLKIKLFLPQKIKIFERWEPRLQAPMDPGGWGLRPQIPVTAPSRCRFLATPLRTLIHKEKIIRVEKLFEN